MASTSAITAAAAVAPVGASQGRKDKTSKHDPRKKNISEVNGDDSSDADFQQEKRRKVAALKKDMSKNIRKSVNFYNVSSSSSSSSSDVTLGTNTSVEDEDMTDCEDIQEVLQNDHLDSLDDIMGAQSILEEEEEDDASAQKTTQDDKNMMEATLAQDKFNQAILGTRCSTPNPSPSTKQINAYVISENDRRETVFEASIYNIIHKSAFEAYKTDIYTIPMQGVTSHAVKVHAEKLIPTKVTISEKYQTKKINSSKK